MPPKRANRIVMAALSGPGWNDTFARAVLHADTTIRRYIWRGSRPKFRADNELTVGDKSASDFVLDAVERLLNGKRSYDPSKDLLSNLNSITDSLIWSEKKHSDRTGIVDRIGSGDDGDEAIDPIATTRDPNLIANERLIHDELREDQKRGFDQLRAS